MDKPYCNLQQHTFQQQTGGDNCWKCGLGKEEHETNLTFRDGVAMERARIRREFMAEQWPSILGLNQLQYERLVRKVIDRICPEEG